MWQKLTYFPKDAQQLAKEMQPFAILWVKKTNLGFSDKSQQIPDLPWVKKW